MKRNKLTWFAMAFFVSATAAPGCAAPDAPADDLLAGNVDGELTDKLRRFTNRLTEFRLQFFDEWMVGGVGRFRTFFLFLDGRFWRSCCCGLFE